MKRHIFVFVLLGATANFLVALALDWHANTEGQSVTIVPADEAMPSLAALFRTDSSCQAIAGWRCVAAGVHTAAVLFGEKRREIEVDVTSNTLRFDLGGGAIDELPPLANGYLFIESRAGWPMKSLVGRAFRPMNPSENAKPTAVSRVPIHVVGADLIVGERPSFERSSLDIDFRRNELDSHNRERSKMIRPDIKNFTFSVPTDEGFDFSLGEPIRQFVPKSNTHTSRSASTVDDLRITGHMSIGAPLVRPIPAAANGRWNFASVAQNFDRDHRAWPLALRPTWPGFLINAAFYALLIWFSVALLTAALRATRTKRGLCPRCAYDLRGATHQRCPECGNVQTSSNRTTPAQPPATR